MNSNKIFQWNVEKSSVADRSDITQHHASCAVPTVSSECAGKLLTNFRPSMLIGAILVASGLFHLALLWVTGGDWSGPLSPRKPALFGVSAGITVWSIAWALTRLAPRHYDEILANFMSGSLLFEVGLITLQQWRGVPSHFNRATRFDASVESMMLGLILLVTAGIAWLCWRSRWLQPMLDSDAIAIRAGLWLLLVSCGLGLLITIAGEFNLARGNSPELWGRAGVLKYPHGAALHAIQTLPFLSALLNKLNVSHTSLLIKATVVAHVFFLTHALWQTWNGRTRMDVDLVGGATLAIAGSLVLLPLIASVCRVYLITRDFFFGRHSIHRSK